MTNENKKRYPDRINKMLLEDPYRPLHDWVTTNNKQYLENLKQSTGIEPKRGYWSPKEVKRLEDNMKLYQSLNPNVKIFKLLYNDSPTRRKVFKETGFWDLISYKLCRKLVSINVCVTNHFIKTAGYKTGPFSKQELGILIKLVNQHGSNWQLISSLMNRSAIKLCIAYNDNIKNNINKGTWNTEEKEKFICIVKQLMHYNQRNQLPLSKINWSVVSDFVQTRNSASCRYFFSYNKQKINKLMLANMYNYSSNTKLTSLKKEAIILYTYFSTNQSAVELNRKELFLLFDGKYNENELQKEYNNIISVLPNCDIKASIRLEHTELIEQSENLFKRINFENVVKTPNCDIKASIRLEHTEIIEQSENLFKRINFENVVKTMSNARTVSWLKTKYYILVNENVENFEEKNSEEIISMMHDKYCTTKLLNKDNKSNETQSFVREKINSSIDLTFLSDDDSISDNISDDEELHDYNDLTHLSGHSDIADVLESDEVINIDYYNHLSNANYVSLDFLLCKRAIVFNSFFSESLKCYPRNSALSARTFVTRFLRNSSLVFF